MTDAKHLTPEELLIKHELLWATGPMPRRHAIEAIKEAIAQERKACAEMCETLLANELPPICSWGEVAMKCAARIRARGE